MAVHIDPLTLAIGATAVAGIALAIYGFGQISDAIDDCFAGDCFGEIPPEDMAAARPETGGEGLAAAGSGQVGAMSLTHREDER